jgi:hypothetical protein
MKKIQTLVGSLLACGVVMAMVSTLAAQTPEQVTAKVVRIKGFARYTNGTNTWQPLKVGMILNAGVVVQTSRDQGAYVDLVFGQEDKHAALPAELSATPGSGGGSGFEPKATQNLVRLQRNTVLGLDKLTSLQTGADTITETQLDLKAGRITGMVKKMSAASKYEIKLPNGVAAIRGTIYDIAITPAGGANTTVGVQVTVLSGSVVFAFEKADGSVQTIVVELNQQGNSVTGVVVPLTGAQIQQYDAEVQAIIANLPAGAAAPPTIMQGFDQTIIQTSHTGN